MALNFLPQKVLLAPPTFVFWLFGSCVIAMCVQYAVGRLRKARCSLCGERCEVHICDQALWYFCTHCNHWEGEVDD